MRDGKAIAAPASLSRPSASAIPIIRGRGHRTECLELNFRGEPLGVASKHGFESYDAQFGEVIGPEDGSTEYITERKLGWGFSSSVWLAGCVLFTRLCCGL